VAGYCESGNKPFGSINCREFIDWLRSCQLLRKFTAPNIQLAIQFTAPTLLAIQFTAPNIQLAIQYTAPTSS
jgi:hypothetical protein